MAASAPPPDLEALARDWVTLWQSELAAIATDREAQETWQAILRLWAGAAGAMLAAAPHVWPPSATGPSEAPPSGVSTSGTPASDTPASDGPTSDAPASSAPASSRHASSASAPPEAVPQPVPAPDDPPDRRARTAAPPGAAPVAAAPDPRDAEIDRLARHVAELESRLGELEHGVRRGGGRHRRGTAGPDPRRQRR